ncbi:MAG: hypothetical protein IPP33_05895 [Flavobacteriales bacterium]|nr:hypothetical protein [Flavobacteriales bacterium]
MTKERLLSFAVLLLLVLNGITVFMLLRGSDRHGPPPEDRPKQMVIDRLGFDVEQVKRYEALIDLHRVAIGEKDRALRSVRVELFHALGSSSTTERDSWPMLSERSKLLWNGSTMIVSPQYVRCASPNNWRTSMRWQRNFPVSLGSTRRIVKDHEIVVRLLPS